MGNRNDEIGIRNSIFSTLLEGNIHFFSNLTPSPLQECPKNVQKVPLNALQFSKKCNPTYFLTSSKLLNLYKKILSDIEGIKIGQKNHPFSEDKTINLGKFFLYNQKYTINP